MVYTLIDLVRFAAMVFTLLIFARVILSWVAPSQSNQLVDWIYRLTEPVLGPLRNLLPAMGGLDLTPIIALFGIQIIERILIQVLLEIGG